MNKTNTAESILNMIKSVCAERDRKERDRLRANRIEMDKREKAESERRKNTDSIINSCAVKAMERESQHTQERNQMMRDERMRRRSESEQRSQEMTAAINRGIQKAREDESRDIAGAFMDRHRRLLDKGREVVKRERNKTYFS